MKTISVSPLGYVHMYKITVYALTDFYNQIYAFKHKHRTEHNIYRHRISQAFHSYINSSTE